jgi:hypothetical protein
MPTSLNVKNNLIRSAKSFFLLNALIWTALSLLSLGKIRVNQEVPNQLPWIIFSLMLGNAGAMFASAIILGRREKSFYNMAVIVVSVNILLTFTDQISTFDWITLVIDIILLGILVAARKEYS